MELHAVMRKQRVRRKQGSFMGLQILKQVEFRCPSRSASVFRNAAVLQTMHLPVMLFPPPLPVFNAQLLPVTLPVTKLELQFVVLLSNPGGIECRAAFIRG